MYVLIVTNVEAKKKKKKKKKKRKKKEKRRRAEIQAAGSFSELRLWS